MSWVKIRFNNLSVSNNDKWRLLKDNGIEVTVSSILIDDNIYTSNDILDGVGSKWHLTVEGNCNIINNVAYIKTSHLKSDLKRHILKTVSYRFLGTLTTIMVALILGAPIEIASLLGVGELVLKPIIYFLHERIWFKYIRIN